MGKYDKPMMETARIWANMSYCKKRKVGAILAKENRPILSGYNGTISKMPNDCEDEIDGVLKTSEFTLHAEQNIISHAAKNGISTNGCTLYVTTSPCKTCAKLIAQSGIKKVFYDEIYKDKDGIEYLIKVGVEVEKFDN